MKISVTKQPSGEWTSIDDDTYEAEWDGVAWISNSPQGYGATEAEAIADLLAEIGERA